MRWHVHVSVCMRAPGLLKQPHASERHLPVDAPPLRAQMLETHQKGIHDALTGMEGEAERLYREERPLLDDDSRCDPLASGTKCPLDVCWRGARRAEHCMPSCHTHPTLLNPQAANHRLLFSLPCPSASATGCTSVRSGWARC